MDPLLKLREGQRPVVKSRRQTETVIDQHFFSRPVAVIHRPHLGHHHMAFVNEQQEILGHIVQQRIRRRTRLPAGHDTGIVFDARAKADFPQHLHIVFGALTNALRLDQLAVFFKIFDTLLHFGLNIPKCLFQFVLGCDIMRSRIDGHMIQKAHGCAGNRMDLGNPIDFIPEELHANGIVIGVSQPNFQRITPNAEAVSLKSQIVALVLKLYQTAAQRIPIPGVSGAQRDHHIGIIDGVAQRVDTGYRGHNDHIPPLKETGSGAVAQPIQFCVYIGIFFDVGIGGRNISLRLIIIIV